MYYSLVYFCLFHHKKFFIIWTWSKFVINQLWLIPPVLALLHGNCPLTFKLRSYFVFLQKLLSSGVSFKKGCSWRFHGFREGAAVLQSFFNKATGLRACGFIEGRLQRGDFSCVICEIFEGTYFDEHLLTTTSDSLNFDILLG